MAGEFVALADLLRAPAAHPAPDGAPNASLAAARDAVCGDDDVGDAAPNSIEDAVYEDVAAAVREARLFRARLADAFDDAAARLLRELATDVLARELRLAPCDLAAIVRRIGERAPIVRVRVAACDAPALARMLVSRGCDAVVAEGPSLRRGDAIVELVDGALDARLGVRLATVLEAFA